MKEFADYMTELNIQKYSIHTMRIYSKSIGDFLNHFEIGTLEAIKKIKKKQILAYQNHLLETGLAPSSVNSRVRCVSAFFHWLREQELLNSIPVENLKAIKEPKKAPVFLSEEEQAKMIDACKNLQEKSMIALMLATGLREEEITKVKTIDIQDNHIIVHGKGDKQRVLAINSKAMGFISEYLKQNTNEYLFVSRRGSHAISTTSIYKRVKRIAQDAGIEPERLKMITPHKLRHTLATNLVSDGVDIKVIQEVLGHSAIATTMRYAHVRSSKMDDALLSHAL